MNTTADDNITYGSIKLPTLDKIRRFPIFNKPSNHVKESNDTFAYVVKQYIHTS